MAPTPVARRRPHAALRHPWRVVIAAIAVALAGALVGIPSLSSLSPQGFDVPGGQAVRAAQLVERATGAEATPSIIALVRPGGPVASPRGRMVLRDVRARIARAAGADLAGIAGPAAAPGDPFVSRDGTRALLAVTLRDPARDSDVVRALGEIPSVTLGGRAVANDQVNRLVIHDLARAELIALPILFLLALWVFRGVVAALIPPLVGGVVMLGAFLGLGLVNRVMDISIYSVNLVTGLSLGLAIDYSLLVVSRFREELARLGPGVEAVAATVRTAGRSVAFSAVTVAASMSGLTVFAQGFLISIGVGGALVALLAGFAATALLPALLLVLGPRVNGLALPGWRARSEAADATQGGWYRLARGVMRRPGRIAAATSALLVVAALPALGIRFTTIDASVLPADESARVVADAMRRDFPLDMTAPVLVVVDAPPGGAAAVAAYARALRQLPGASAVRVGRGPVGGIWPLSVIPAAPALSGRTQGLIRAIRAAPAPSPVLVGGLTAGFVDQKTSLRERLPAAVAIVAVVTIAILFLMTGSVLLPLKAVLMNALTLGATLGLLVLVFQDGHLEGLLRYRGSGGLDVTQPILIAALAFGLSTDYAVFLLSRIREAHEAGLPNREAVARGLERTGRVVTAAALLFCVAVGAFATSRIIVVKELGIGTALAVLLDATIVRALLMPALMALLGPWNWWAPGPLRRLHRRIGPRAGPTQPAEPPLRDGATPADHAVRGRALTRRERARAVRRRGPAPP